MPIRRIIRRLKNTRTNRTHSTNWGDFHAEVDAQFQLLGASVVGSWEVLLTDASRSHRNGHGSEMPNELYQRLSDSIVPLQQCIQSQTNSLKHAIKQYAELSTPAVLNLREFVESFSTELSQSWIKSCTYLKPVLSKMAFEDLIMQWETGANTLLIALQEHSELLGPPTSNLNLSKSALIKWREATVRTIEIELYARRTELCHALGA